MSKTSPLTTFASVACIYAFISAILLGLVFRSAPIAILPEYTWFGYSVVLIPVALVAAYRNDKPLAMLLLYACCVYVALWGVRLGWQNPLTFGNSGSSPGWGIEVANSFIFATLLGVVNIVPMLVVVLSGRAYFDSRRGSDT